MRAKFSHKIYITIVLLFIIKTATSQFQGKIIDAKLKTPVSFAYVYANIQKIATTTDENGYFNFPKIKSNKPIEITIQHLLYGIIKIQTKNNSILSITAKKLMVEDIIVTAQSKKNNTSTSVIKKNAIAHIQATSFSDILSLMPGNRSLKKNFFSTNTINLRQANYDYNTGFGTKFLIDGAQISNTANFQSLNTGSFGLYQSNSITNKGVDMRNIGTDDIEKVEIIKGIASVEYGDLTSGVVKISRKKGNNPIEIRSKLDNDSKLFSISKGFGNDKQSVNISTNILNTKKDPRSDLTNYYRLGASARFNKNFKHNDHFFNYNINLDYNKTLLGSKKDIDASYSYEDSYENNNNNFNFYSDFKWENLKNKFIKLFLVSSSIAYSKNTIIKKKLTTAGRDIPIPTVDEGRAEAIFLPAEYQSKLKNDNQPFSARLKLKLSNTLNTNTFQNKLTIGGEYSYDKNLGKGDIFDKNLPPYPGSAYRPIPYKDIKAMKIIAGYSELISKFIYKENSFSLKYGVRLNQILDLNKKFNIYNKIFIDNRFSFNWKLPIFNFLNKKNSLEFGFGVGTLSKLPSLSMLYPGYKYWDYTELNFLSNTKPEYNTVYTYTQKKDITNYNIKEAINRKIELNLSYKIGKINLNICAFKEQTHSNFSSIYFLQVNEFRDYKESEIDITTLTQKPNPKNINYDLIKRFEINSSAGNGDYTQKKGIDLTLSLPKINTLKTKLTINGAWYKTTNDISSERYQSVSGIYDGKRYPYIGVYNWNRGKEFEMLTTNMFFDTALNKLGLIFTTKVQITWFNQSNYIPNNGQPNYYFDKNLNRYEFTSESIKNSFIDKMRVKNIEGQINKEKTPIDIGINFMVTKKFANNLQMSCFVNSVVNYLPEYKDRYGITQIRKRYPYASMEIKIKI